MSNKIYLAGKISKYNWRNELLKENRIEEFEKTYMLDERLEYTGPYFISCDHGCYHGDRTHGRRAEKGAICEDYYESREKTISKCYQWIDNADILFCWIDDVTAYGTFTEIGYASAKNKIIYIACDKKIGEESTEIWFPLLSSNVLVYEDSIEDAWSNFTKWYDSGMNKNYHKLHSTITENQYYFILGLLEKSKYELLVDSIDLWNITSETAGKIIAVLKNKNKTIEDYKLYDILKLRENTKEKESFYYIEKPHIVKSQISNFLKKNLSFEKENKTLMNSYDVNNINRVKIAREFAEKIISEKSYSFISGESNMDLFIEDIAIRIDSIIPRQYYTKYISLLYPELQYSFITENFLGKDNYVFTKDLIYKYEENNNELIFKPGLVDNRIDIYKDYEKAKKITERNNIKKEKKKLEKMSKEEKFSYKRKLREKNNEKIPPTKAQLDFLEVLVDKNGYTLKNIHELDIDSTSDLIDALKNKTTINNNLANKFIITEA